MTDGELVARPVRALVGLSGARVALMTKDDRTWFVRKTAVGAAQSARLRAQMAKQAAFAAVVGDVVRVPRILDAGERDGDFFFDMEFVRGVDGVSFLRRASQAEVAALADRLRAYIEAIARQPPTIETSRGLFEASYAKVCEVQRKTSAIADDTLARLFLALEPLRRVGAGLTPTACHGDLTLENLIVDDTGQVWLVDLLDAPFEHYWQDVVKLHQDLEGGWYLLGHPPVARYVLEYVGRRVRTAVAAVGEGYAQIHAVLLACTFVRILPYVRGDQERQFVLARVEHFARRAVAQGAP